MGLEIKNLKKKFGDKVVLDGISISLKQGDIVFVLGRSGTGKSVLLKNIVGLLKPDEGEIFLEGEKISGLTEEEYLPIRKKCGMVFQNPALFDSMTVFENVAFGIKNSRNDSEVHLALSKVNLDRHYFDKRPHQLSYGEQKRVSLARTIAVGPSYLLFDEPTTGLDPSMTHSINTLISKLSKELRTTSIVVSHDMGCALAIADKIIVLDAGKIISQGTPKELKKSSNDLVQKFLKEAEVF